MAEKQTNISNFAFGKYEERPLFEFTALLKIAIVLLALAIAAAILFLPTPIALGIFFGMVFLGAIAVNPYFGLMIVVFASFIQPTRFFPQLQPLHIVRFLSIITLFSWGFSMIIRENTYLVRTKQNAFILGFCLLIFFSALQHPFYSLMFFLESLKVFILYFLIVNLIANRQLLKTFINTLGVLGIIMALIGIWQYMHGIGIVYAYEGILRITGTLDDPNDFALHLIVILPLLVYIYRINSNLVVKVFALGGFSLVLLATIFTFSRGGFFGLAISLFLIVKQFVLQKRMRQWLYFAVIFLILLLLIPYVPKTYWERLQPKDILSDPAVVSRLQAWQTGWEMIKDKPLSGIGLATFHYFYLPYAPAGVDPMRNIVAHNMFINVSAENGIPALILFLTIITYAFIGLRRSRADFKKNGDREMIFLCDSLQISLIGFVTCSMFLSVEWLTALWIIIALAAVARKISLNRLPLQ